MLFGDSHALQYFPAVERIALDRGWRLVHLSKGGCPPAPARLRHPPTLERYNRACREWRESALRRIAREKPFLVIAAGSTHYHVYEGSRRLGRRGSLRALARGYARILRRLTALAPAVTFIRDSPRPPLDVAGCVAAHMGDLRRCAFRRPVALTRPDSDQPRRRVGRRRAGRRPAARAVPDAAVPCRHRRRARLARRGAHHGDLRRDDGALARAPR